MKIFIILFTLFIPVLFGDSFFDYSEDLCNLKVPSAIEISFQDIPCVQLIEKVSVEEGVDTLLVMAVVKQESNFNPYAMRFEPNYYKKLMRTKRYTADEAKRRSYSYGLGQVLGDTARYMNFTGPFGDLLDPETNLRLTCRKLKWCLDRFDGKVSHAISGYNGGAFVVGDYIHITNAPYVESVLLNLNTYKRGVLCTIKAGWSMRS